MPDPLRKSVSATQVPMLFGLSPWGTAWTVHQYLRHGIEDKNVPEAAIIGRALQPVVLRLASERLSLDIEDNDQDLYYRHHSLPLGCTVDGLVRCPSRGLGVVEVKCVNETSFRTTWNNGPPPHVVLQTQVQMLVLNAQWGKVAALEGCSSLHLFDVHPLTQGEIDRVVDAATDALRRAEQDRPPPAFGTSREWNVAMQLAANHPASAPAVLPEEATPCIERMLTYGRMSTTARREYERARNALLAMMNGARTAVSHDGKHELRLAGRTLKVKGQHDDGTEEHSVHDPQ